MFKNRSKVLFVAAVLATLYLIYVVYYFMSINDTSATADSTEALGSAIATVMVLPHMLVLFIGVLLNWVGFGTRKNGFNLAAAILYCVSAGIFLLYAIFLVPSIVLGFVGYSKQKSINKSLQVTE